MKFDISLEAKLDEETGAITATIKGDLPDELLAGFGKLATALAAIATKQLADKEAKNAATTTK